jgi:L-ribulose-5-phosphate 3-epimerase UlaE
VLLYGKSLDRLCVSDATVGQLTENFVRESTIINVMSFSGNRYFKFCCEASVTKTFTLKVVQSFLLKHPALSVKLTLNRNYPR